MRSRFCCVLAASALTVVGIPGAGEARARGPRAITIKQAVSLALGRNHAIRQALAKVHLAEAKRKQTRGKLGPTLSADAAISVWNEAFSIDVVRLPAASRLSACAS